MPQNPMSQNSLGINMGDILSKVSNLKTARMGREQAATKFEHYKEDRKLKQMQAGRKTKGAEALKKEFDIPSELTNDQIGTYIDLKKSKSAEGKAQLAATKERLDMIGQGLVAVHQNPELYEKMRAKFIEIDPTFAKSIPETYDAGWVQNSMALSVQGAKILEGEAEEKRDISKEERRGKRDIKLEGVKQENKLALEEMKQVNKTGTKKLKLEKLFDLKTKYKENKEVLKIINKAIKLASEGKASAIDKFLAAELGGGETTTAKTTKAPKTADNYLKGL